MPFIGEVLADGFALRLSIQLIVESCVDQGSVNHKGRKGNKQAACLMQFSHLSCTSAITCLHNKQHSTQRLLHKRNIIQLKIIEWKSIHSLRRWYRATYKALSRFQLPDSLLNIIISICQYYRRNFSAHQTLASHLSLTRLSSIQDVASNRCRHTKAHRRSP